MKVLILGYYGYDNFGDEWSLREVMAAIRCVAPDSEIAVISGNCQRTVVLHGITAVGRGPAQLRKAICDADLLVCGGGSLLQDVTSARSLLYYLWVLEYALHKGKKVMVWGEGLGPLNRKKLRSWTGRILAKADLLTWRDESSYALAKAVGVPEDKMILAADPVFSRRGLIWPRGEGQEQRALCTVVLREWPGWPADDWVPALAQSVAEMVRKNQFQVLALGIQGEKDAPVLRDFVQALTSRGISVEVKVGWESLEEVAEIIAQTEILIAQRYHALALGAELGCRCLALSYDPKMVALATVLGVPFVSREDWAKHDFAAGRADNKALVGLHQAAERSVTAFKEFVLKDNGGEYLA